MTSPQPGILADVPPLSRSLVFQLVAGEDPREALRELVALSGEESGVVGIGVPLAEETQMGPLATTGQLAKIEREVAHAQEEFAGGRPFQFINNVDAEYVGPDERPLSAP